MFSIRKRCVRLDLPITVLAARGKIVLSSQRTVVRKQKLIRLVNAARYAQACAFMAAQDVAVLALRQHGAIRGNAAIAIAVLDLAAGDLAQVVSRFAGVAVEPARREALVLAAFTGLVNAARYDAAEALARTEPCFAALETLAGRAADDARIAYFLLDSPRRPNSRATRRWRAG
jgi:hypothetical protein